MSLTAAVQAVWVAPILVALSRQALEPPWENLSDLLRSRAEVAMTSHDLPQARRLAGDIPFLHHGQVLERATAAAFFAGPHSPEAAAPGRGELPW